MFEFDLKSAPFVRATVDEVRAADPANEQMYQMSESFFGTVGPRLVSLGWSVFPQERDGKRTSGRVDGAAIKWKPYQTRLPTAEEMAKWAAQCPSHNVAIITGAASGHTFVIDVDICEEALAWRVRELADEFLGPTPLKRIGRDPRIVLVYRTDPEASLNRRSYRFTTTDEHGAVAASEDLVEILAAGSPYTAYGRHHKTQKYFRWPENQPLFVGPECAPLVTVEQLAAFLAAVQQVRPFYRKAAGLSVDANWEYDENSKLIVPKLSGANANWVEDASGLVIDGREQFLWELVKRAVRVNAQATGGGEAGERSLTGLVINEFRAKAALTGKWDMTYLKVEAQEKVRRAIQNFKETGAAGFTPQRRADGTFAPEMPRLELPARTGVEGMDSLSFLPPTGGAGRGPVKAHLGPAADSALADERRLIPDRSAIAVKVQEDIHRALDSFFSEVYAEEAGVKRIHVLKAPTGGGKTSLTIKYVAADQRTKKLDEAKAKGAEPPGPILFLLPTYNNIEELRLRANVLNLDSSLDDAGLAEQALALGLIHEDEIEARVGDLRRDAIGAGMRTMIYRGKMSAGCLMAEKMKLLMEAGISTSGLCRAEVRDKDRNKEVVECVHYQTCPAIQQRKQIADCHVVFLPHAFLTLSIPEELKKVRCVIADERVFHLFVHTASMSQVTLNLPRKRPVLTAREKKFLEEGAEGALTPEGLIQSRDAASMVAANALVRGDCPALALFDYREVTALGKTVTGLELVKHAKRVCGNALTSNAEISPKTSIEELETICRTPTGTEIREEWRFWAIVEERIEDMMHDRLHDGLVADSRANRAAARARLIEAGSAPPEEGPSVFETAWKRKAMGDREMRIQFLLERSEDGTVQETVRLSWRSKPNWADASLLLLDASASPEIIGKIFNEREVAVHNVEAPLNVRTVAVLDRTYSNSSIVAGVGKLPGVRIQSGRLKHALRCAIATISAQYGWGRVVCGASVIVRRALNQDWKQPTNIDWCHFGAMRGLDFAKHHTAALSIGRMEVPVKIIDGLVAALTYDDVEPEYPYDRKGDNTGADNEPLKLPYDTQTMKMRSGQDATVLVPRFPGYWASKVQEQYREEELSQFLGRLRPVYREGEAPVWFAISKVIPSHVIVDDIVALSDIVRRPSVGRYIVGTLWDAVRKANGIAHPDLLAAANVNVYDDAAAAAADMREFDLDSLTGKIGLELRSTWGFTSVRIAAPDGSSNYAFIRTDIREPIEAIKEAFQTFLGWTLTDADVEVGESPRPYVASGKREADWVDEQIGSLEARANGEYHALATASTWAVDNLPSSSFTTVSGQPQRMPVAITTPDNDDELAGFKLIVPEIAATQTTDTMWSKIRAGHQDRLTARISTPGAEFDHLGDGAFDDDEGGD